MREVRLNGVRASIAMAHNRKSCNMHKKIVRSRFVFRIAKRDILHSILVHALLFDEI